MKRILTLILILNFSACSLHSVSDYTQAPIPFPAAFQHTENSAQSAENEPPWKTFQDSQLDELIELAFRDNLSLKQAWARLKQARELAISQGAELYPQLGASASADNNKFIQRGEENPFQRNLFPDLYTSSGQLSYELDLWAKIYSRAEAATLRAQAVEFDTQQTAILLAARICEVWFALAEASQLLVVLEQQSKSSATFLNLTELRFSLGQGTAVEVLQQRQQLEAVKAEIPLVLAARERSWNELSVLLGTTPQELKMGFTPESLPSLPELSGTLAPLSLLESRPDLRAARMKVQAEDYEVAAALAERMPSLSVSLRYTFSALTWGDIFNRELRNIAGNILLPLIDGGRRRAAVRSQEARVEEALAAYANASLSAIQEVEDALNDERAQVELLEIVERRLSIARQLQLETRNRYLNGLLSYLDVIIATQSLQALERQQLSTRRNLLAARVRLQRALGGSWPAQILHPEFGLDKKSTQEART